MEYHRLVCLHLLQSLSLSLSLLFIPTFFFLNVNTAYSAGRMKIFYDWSQKSMIEHYIDACVPIFPEFTTPFECKFVNVNMTSYLVTFNSSRPESFPPCCVFGKPFHPPSTTFLNNLSKRVLPDPSYIYDHRVTFWELEDIPPPTGPFFYAWKTPLSETEEVYSTFAFPGNRRVGNTKFSQCLFKSTCTRSLDITRRAMWTFRTQLK